MRVLQVHTSDYVGGGGGAIAMYRLHLGLRKAGVDSKILCGTKSIDSPHTFQIPHSPRLRELGSKIRKVTSRLGLNDIHYLNSFGVKQHQAYLNADIVNFHGTHGFFSYLAIPSLTEDKPGVFTLHDVWPFTGHCAVSYDCERWKIGCGRCPYPEAHPAIRRDNTRLEWKLKDWVYSRSNLAIVTLCNQVTKQAKQSMLNRFAIHQIPNGVDTEVYEPLDPEQCRSLLGIPPDKKVLMVAALRLDQSHKGGNLLLKSLQGLPESLKAETVLLLLGGRGEAIARSVDLQTINLGYVSHDRLKAICYSAASLFIHPTRADNLPLVLQESMACGTPTVAFGVGGVPDLVRPGITGYLAEPEDAQDLCNGIVQLLEDEPLRDYLGQQGRAVVLEEYSLNLQVQRYVQLYNQVLQDWVVQTKNDSVSEFSV
jgi:glycosyltransferase involved in cell wall biosynthesis